MDGLVVMYLNYHPDLGQDLATTIECFKSSNKEWMDRINEESSYKIIIVPTTKEACRIEKVDFHKPFPRFVARNHMDVEFLEKRREEKEEKALFKQTELLKKKEEHD